MRLKTLLLTSLFILSHAVLAKINLNTATVEELVLLKGIGTVKAQAIVDYRKEHGDFTSLEQLSSVKGIGKALLAKITPHLTLDEPTNLSDISAR